ncbi:MAG: helix-turn-helix domain-containing protein [Planctomycetaceae bacterium]|nr:helix-turn-helix domain-containing protein [Planctomycetaceae bacterium]
MATVALPSPLVDEKRAAEILGITPGTLSVWRCVRRYNLPYTKIGRAVRYRVEDLEAFVRSRTVGGAAE